MLPSDMAAPERIGLAMNLHYTAAKVPLASLICPDISLDPKKSRAAHAVRLFVHLDFLATIKHCHQEVYTVLGNRVVRFPVFKESGDHDEIEYQHE